MASTSGAGHKPTRGILKKCGSDKKIESNARNPRKLPQWMQNGAIKKTLPTFSIPSSCSIVYSFNANDCAVVCNEFLKSLRGPSHIGFDIEWPVTYEHGKQGRTAVIQFCHIPDEVCFVFHVSCMNSIPKPLKEVIERVDVIKVGVNVEGDIQKLCRDFDLIFPQSGFVDLGSFANERLMSNERWSLAGLVKFLFNCDLPKVDSIRKGSWHLYPLTEQQLHYAALDAIASVKIYNQILCRSQLQFTS